MGESNDPFILVVDDDPVTRLRVHRAIEGFGYRNVKEAADGLEAQEHLRSRKYDLVITDILMPGLDGIELLKWGRENTPGPQWILLSGVDTFDAAVEAIRSGAFDFIAKPPGMEELEVSVRNALEQNRLIAERDRLYGELEETNEQLLEKVRELEEKSEHLRRDLQRAEIIQRALLPTIPPPIDRYCVQAMYRPGQYVGGDLYDVIPLTDRYVGIYVADASGHGVTAAMLSVLYKQRLVLLDEDTGEPFSPSAVLESVNRALLESVAAPGLFLTAAYCLLDTLQGVVTIASAGHPPVAHVHPNGEVRLIEKTGPALGLTEDAHFTEESFQLQVDDRLMLYTDGLLQSTSALEKLRELLTKDPFCGAEMVTRIMGSNGSQAPVDGVERDDVTVLLLDVHAGLSHFDNGAAERKEKRGAMPRADVLYYGEGDGEVFLAIRGRAIWTHCDALYEAASGILETGRPLVLDLSECEYMDSTCLGTVHELVSKGNVSLQGVQPQVQELFEELTMERVLQNIRPEASRPELYPLAVATSDAFAGPMRILRAHEALAGLSAQNRDKFQEVLEALRGEMSRN